MIHFPKSSLSKCWRCCGNTPFIALFVGFSLFACLFFKLALKCMYLQPLCKSKLSALFWERVLLAGIRHYYLYFPDWGAEDKNEPISWRQFNKRGLESWWEAFCNRRSAWTVLSVCKFSVSVTLKTKLERNILSQSNVSFDAFFSIFFCVCIKNESSQKCLKKKNLQILWNSYEQYTDATISAAFLFLCSS